jgi:hypothetical protein
MVDEGATADAKGRHEHASGCSVYKKRGEAR